MDPQENDSFDFKEWYDAHHFFRNYQAKVKADYHSLELKNLPITVCFLKPEIYNIYYRFGDMEIISHDEIFLAIELLNRFLINKFVENRSLMENDENATIMLPGNALLTVMNILCIATKFLKRSNGITFHHVKQIIEWAGGEIDVDVIKTHEIMILELLDFNVDIPMIHTHCQALFEFINGTEFGIERAKFFSECVTTVKLYYSMICKMIESLQAKCLNKELVSAGILCAILFKNECRNLRRAYTKIENAIHYRKDQFLDISVVLLRKILENENIRMGDMIL